MVNAYPFFAYAANSDVISLDYALLKENPGVVDSGNGLKYHSLLEAQLDAVHSAMSAVQYNDVKLVVTETGWPSMGDEAEIGAGEANAGCVQRKLSEESSDRKWDPLETAGTTRRLPNEKPGPTSERNYGLFYPNEKRVYDVPFTLEQVGDGQSTPVNKSSSPVPAVQSDGKVSTTSTAGQTWCVANGNAGDEKLQAGLDYACGEGGADCRPIQVGSACYSPSTVEAHASYAFNSYYQKKARRAGTCDFGGAAYVVTQQPGFGNCKFPTDGGA
uniref:glucan endo-1,3-beta-D-glucosidase n=1 Tax=Salix viminalis TaxID=40686 RepID=A0A6N2MZF2_SALVM